MVPDQFQPEFGERVLGIAEAPLVHTRPVDELCMAVAAGAAEAALPSFLVLRKQCRSWSQEVDVHLIASFGSAVLVSALMTASTPE